jgi:hypothetical protein
MPIPSSTFNIAAQLPALTPIEDAVAKAWLTKHATEYDSVDFNVRVGSGIQLPDSSPDYMKLYARQATTKRCDMVLHKGTEATIVEVKIRVGGSALGQLLLYKRLYQADHPEVTAVHLIAAGQTIEPDVQEAYDELNIPVELFPSAQIV